jgi:hypothetical protein
MAKTTPPDPKPDVLRHHGSLNPHPGRVQDPLFATADFFDARDLVQVKYEMVRLLEICALTDTLILDEDGVYDPAHFNDRLRRERVDGTARGVPRLFCIERSATRQWLRT